MKLADFRFNSIYRGNEAFDKEILVIIKKLISRHIAMFEFVNDFFYNYSDNIQSEEEALKTLLNDKEIILIEHELSSKENEFFDILLMKLVSLFGYERKKYSKIRNQYIEMVTLYWKASKGRCSSVYIEPTIFYKRNRCFNKADYANIKCDIVHIDRRRMHFELYECKTTMRLFLEHLSSDSRKATTKDNKKSILRSKRKQNYLSAFNNLLKYKVDDLKFKEIAYVTLAPKRDLMIKGENRDCIGEIDIITREKIEDLYPQMDLLNQLVV